MCLIVKAQNLLKKIDLFGSPINLSYAGQNKFKTAIGGFLSFLILLTIIIVFKDTIILFITKSQANFNERIQFDSYSRINFNQDNFIFGVGMNGFNLSNYDEYKRYFQIKIEYKNYFGKTELVPLQPCKLQDWQKLGQDFSRTFTTNKMQNFLCSPKNYSYEIIGQFGLDQFKYLKFSINQCNIKINKCHQFLTQTYNLALNKQYFQFNFIYSKSIIQKKKTYQTFKRLPQKITYRFIPEVQALLIDQFISNITVSTDTSFLPFPIIQQQHSFQFQTPKQNNLISLITKDYLYFYIKAKSQVKIVQRKVQSLDQFLSFLGGMFGIFSIIGQFFIEPFSEFLLKLSIFNSFFFRRRMDQNKQIALQNINFNFVEILFFKFINYFKQLFSCCSSRSQINDFQLIQSSIDKSLDVNYLLNRIHLLQKLIVTLHQDESQLEEFQKHYKIDADAHINHTQFQIGPELFLRQIEWLKQLQSSKRRIKNKKIKTFIQNKRQSLDILC